MRKLLFLAHRIPYPPEKGDKIRAWHLLAHLMATHEVHLGCMIDDPADWAHVPALRARCADLACFGLSPSLRKLAALTRVRPGRPLTLGYFHDPRLHAWVRATLAREPIDLAFAYSSAMAPYLMSAHLMSLRGVPRVLDLVDLDSAKWSAYAGAARWPVRALWAREGRTLLGFEQEAVARFEASMLVSAAERRLLHARAPDAAARVSVVPNGVDLRRFAPGLALQDPFTGEAPRIVFTGAMDYRPNIDAVAWFAETVLPALRRAARPPALWIVGANPAAAVRGLARLSGVHVTGRVADTRPYIAHADLIVAPLRIARGVQNKVLEAMAMARPVVASPEAAAGLPDGAASSLLLAADAEAMAARAGEVLAGAHPGLGMAARRAVEAHCGWPGALAAFDRVLAALPQRGRLDRQPAPAVEAAA